MHVQSCYFATQHEVIEFPEGTSDCSEPKTFKNFFPQKTRRNTYDEGER